MLSPKSHRTPPSTYLSPCFQFSFPEPPTRPSSAFEDFTLFDVPESRPSSGIFASSTSSSPHSAMGSQPPTLTEILLDVAPPPWTLSAFMAYLSSNHCMESLEFTLDLQRYAAIYDQNLAGHSSSLGSNAQLGHLWDKLINVYIAPCSPREINIPSPVRDKLLRVPSRPDPPHPQTLEEAGRIIHELMNDSLLVPFLESVSPLHLDTSGHPQGRSPNFPPYLTVGSADAASPRSGSTHGSELESSLTDDSDGYSPPHNEPMTPPTTPPTSSEWGFPNSPGGLQRAMAAQKEGWKKFGAKLGLHRKDQPTNKRPAPTSSDPTNRQSHLL
jgi:hypothetical protein